MTVSQHDDYRTLERRSSDELLEADGQQVLGRHEQSAYHTFQAGRLREQMARLRLEQGEYDEAAEDWLSALACYLRAGSVQAAKTVLEQLHRLQREGKISPSREDLHASITQREQEVYELQEREQSSSLT